MRKIDQELTAHANLLCTSEESVETTGRTGIDSSIHSMIQQYVRLRHIEHLLNLSSNLEMPQICV